MKFSFIPIVIVLCFPVIMNAQYNHQFIHFDLEGDVLLDKLRDEHTTPTVLDYGEARDVLFSEIDAVNDTLEAVYTGMKLYLNPNLDPTQAVYLNGVDNGINTEHVYPQSKGAKNGNAKSDMHHLFPSRIRTNGDRASLPFGEINDSSTKKWYYKKTTRTQKPQQNIDYYSEWVNTNFEPRESVKGNIARAMFYFYTIYNDKAMNADPQYFDGQRATLCQWHMQDPIDSTEWARSMKIATFQSGIANPFVLDCSLAQRAYCPEIIDMCYPDAIEELSDLDTKILGHNYPNPFHDKTLIPLNFSRSGYAILSIKNAFDQSSSILFEGDVIVGDLEIEVSQNLLAGFYIYQLAFIPDNGQSVEIQSAKMMKF